MPLHDLDEIAASVVEHGRGHLPHRDWRLREAHTEDEIETYLNADLLRRLWGTMTLPRAVREFWEAQHPILAS